MTNHQDIKPKPLPANQQIKAVQLDLIQHRKVVSERKKNVKKLLHAKVASKEALWFAGGFGFILGDRPPKQTYSEAHEPHRSTVAKAREAASKTGRVATNASEKVHKLIKLGLQMAAWARAFNSLNKRSGQQE
ncbi:MAG: hypothetical protein WED11_05815 [Natronospirillum sp.]